MESRWPPQQRRHFIKCTYRDRMQELTNQYIGYMISINVTVNTRNNHSVIYIYHINICIFGYSSINVSLVWYFETRDANVSMEITVLKYAYIMGNLSIMNELLSCYGDYIASIYFPSIPMTQFEYVSRDPKLVWRRRVSGNEAGCLE